MLGFEIGVGSISKNLCLFESTLLRISLERRNLDCELIEICLHERLSGRSLRSQTRKRHQVISTPSQSFAMNETKLTVNIYSDFTSIFDRTDVLIRLFGMIKEDIYIIH